jgi:hypothetical protein
MYELDAIAAAVIGGVSLLGGEGTLMGALIGALIMGVLRNGLNLLNVSSFVQQVIIGAVIIGAVLVDTSLKRREPNNTVGDRHMRGLTLAIGLVAALAALTGSPAATAGVPTTPTPDARGVRDEDAQPPVLPRHAAWGGGGRSRRRAQAGRAGRRA